MQLAAPLCAHWPCQGYSGEADFHSFHCAGTRSYGESDRSFVLRPQSFVISRSDLGTNSPRYDFRRMCTCVKMPKLPPRACVRSTVHRCLLGGAVMGLISALESSTAEGERTGSSPRYIRTSASAFAGKGAGPNRAHGADVGLYSVKAYVQSLRGRVHAARPLQCSTVIHDVHLELTSNTYSREIAPEELMCFLAPGSLVVSSGIPTDAYCPPVDIKRIRCCYLTQANNDSPTQARNRP
ncbi:hypothetical protein C8Q73DRAFT_423334 [Cubamyces lactineus]|nr:hypothetical protein C8Q73DRAFT_423334 [Cubamyces lactineus]